MTMLEALQDPQTRHAALVHMPIALSIVVLLLAVATAVTRGRNATLRWTTFAACALLVLMSLIAVNSGEAAEGELGLLPEPVSELLETHEERAEKVWIFGAVTGVIVAASMLKERLGMAAAGLGVVAAAATAGWLGLTAHDGGAMVYEWGVGTPQPRTIDGAVASAGDAGGNGAAPGGDPRVAHFTEHVWPVLESNCMRCHNPTRAKRAGKLDQTTIAGMLQGGRSGPAVVPGRPEDSWLMKAVRHEDDLLMPPEEDQLSEETIANLEQWIREGAVWDASVVRAPVPVEEE